ncbi:hypothetical protein ACFVV7_37215 [Streptomyces globisporus]|uniref:hypothetical protein n=1 Tax=Streptomyces globisporus TaxID=1908 RepID=UPI0036DAF9CB
MAKWWKLGFGKDGQEQQPEPVQPEPSPEPAPQEAAPAEKPKKRGGGLLGRLFGRKKKEQKEEPPAPPVEPSAPAEKTGPAAPEPSGEQPVAGEAGGESHEGEGGGEGPATPERTYPPFLHVSAEGDWVISDTEWTGTMSGTVHGADVKTFIDAMEGKGGPDYFIAIPLIAEAYGIPGGLIDVQRSTIRSLDY